MKGTIVMDSVPVKPTPPLQFCLDIGTNSIGWAAFTLDRPGGSVVGFAEGFGAPPMGVRIFPQGRDESKLTTLNATRRKQRLTARRLQRRARQIRALAAFLREERLLPAPGSTEYRDLLRNRNNRTNPYRLRAEAICRNLERYELGRVLLHLAKHRGYDARRRFGSNRGDDDTKKLGPRINALKDVLGGRTLGQFLWHRGWCDGQPRQVRFGKDSEFYPTREMIRGEFDRVRKRQLQAHPLTAEAWKRIGDLIFFRRGIKPGTPGDCPFTNEKRAAKALPVVQRYMLYKTLNDLRPRLDARDIRSIGAWAEQRETVEIKDVRKRLGWPADRLFSIERDRPGAKGRKTIRGNESSAALSHVLGTIWQEADERRREAVVRAALRPREDDAADALIALGLAPEHADAVLQSGLPEGYHAFGEIVIRRVLPHLMEGVDERRALELEGFSEQVGPTSQRLPYYGEILRGQCQPIARKTPNVAPDEQRWGRIPNPTVHIALNQLRLLVNAMLDVWGVPDRIVVETTRKLKLGAKALWAEREQNKENEKRNAEYDKEAATILGHALSGNARESWRLRLALWHRQDRLCLYSDQPISAAALAADLVEIDHVLPRSRTLDDSRQNLVLVFRTANQEKREHTPWDAFDADKLTAIRERAAALYARKQIPKDLLRRFDPVEGRKILENRDWLARQLNDTAYIARIARAYLSCIVPKQRILFPSGAATARAREALELVKDRNDHRHHAMDALAMGLIDWRTIHRLNTASARERELPEIVAPKGMREAALRLLARIVVSHKPDHGRPRSLHGLKSAGGGASPSGELHKMTAYRVIGADGGTATITSAIDGKPQANEKKPVGSLRQIRHTRADGEELTRTVFTGGNGYLEVHELPLAAAGRAARRRTGGEIVTEFDANSIEVLPGGRKRPFQPRWVRTHKGAKLLMRLHKGDMVEIADADAANRYRVVRQMWDTATSPIVLLTPNWCALPVKDAQGAGAGLVRKLRASAFGSSGLRPIAVDVLGRVNHRPRAR
jgi:CRISPR-associated endonuclease Csn1